MSLVLSLDEINFLGDSNKQMAVDVREISELTRYLIYTFLLFPCHTVK